MTPVHQLDEIILDSGPSIALDQLGYIEVLATEGDLLLSLPEPVARELGSRPDRPAGRLPEQLRVRAVGSTEIRQLQRDAGRPILGPGELGVILAAEDQWSRGCARPACAVIDDRDAWEFARARRGGLDRLCGTLSLLYLIHERRLERRPLRQDVEVLVRSAHRLSDAQATRFLDGAEPLLKRARATGATLPAGEAWLRCMREGGLGRQGRRHATPHAHDPSSRIG